MSYTMIVPREHIDSFAKTAYNGQGVIARDAMNASRAFDYRRQEWIPADHVHVLWDENNGTAEGTTCGTDLHTCQPYLRVSEAVG